MHYKDWQNSLSCYAYDCELLQQKDIDWSHPRGEALGAETRAVPVVKRPVASPSGVICRAILSQQWCITIYLEYCQPRKCTQALRSRAFIWAWSHRYGWLPEVSSPTRIWTDAAWLKAPTINHIVSIDYPVLSKGPPYKKVFSRQDIPRLRDCLIGPEGKSQTSLWGKVNTLLHTVEK